VLTVLVQAWRNTLSFSDVANKSPSMAFFFVKMNRIMERFQIGFWNDGG
jgi:hypothetical protein